MALYWFDRTQRYILWVSLTGSRSLISELYEFLVAASVHYSSHLECLLYGRWGKVPPVFHILFFLRLNRKKVPRVFKRFWFSTCSTPIALVPPASCRLNQARELRWWVEVNRLDVHDRSSRQRLGGLSFHYRFLLAAARLAWVADSSWLLSLCMDAAWILHI